MSESILLPDLIFSERLRIDLFSDADAGFILSLLNSESWLKGIGDRNVRNTADALAYVHRINNTENFRYWAVRKQDSGETLGMISCIKRADLDDFDLGFAFLPQYNGKGYALEASRAVMIRLKGQSRFQRLLAFALPSNERSLRLLEKLDFRFVSGYEAHGESLSLYVNDKTYQPGG